MALWIDFLCWINEDDKGRRQQKHRIDPADECETTNREDSGKTLPLRRSIEKDQQQRGWKLVAVARAASADWEKKREQSIWTDEIWAASGWVMWRRVRRTRTGQWDHVKIFESLCWVDWRKLAQPVTVKTSGSEKASISPYIRRWWNSDLLFIDSIKAHTAV